MESTGDARLAQIKARCEAATAGPWCTFIRPRIVSVMAAGKELVHWMGFDGVEMPWRQRAKNAIFIAHARRDVPYLLDEVARLATALDLSHRDPAHANCRNVEAQLERRAGVERQAKEAALDRLHKAMLATGETTFTLERDLAEVVRELRQAKGAAEAHCRNHHLEACESCAATESALRAAEARVRELEAHNMALRANLRESERQRGVLQEQLDINTPKEALNDLRTRLAVGNEMAERAVSKDEEYATCQICGAQALTGESVRHEEGCPVRRWEEGQ